MTYAADLTCPYCGSLRVIKIPGQRTASCTGCGRGGHVTKFRPRPPVVIEPGLRWPDPKTPAVDQPRTSTKRMWSTGAAR